MRIFYLIFIALSYHFASHCAIPEKNTFVTTELLSSTHKSNTQQQEKPYLVNISNHPHANDFHEAILRESNIPRESYIPINYVGFLTKKEFDLCAKGCEQRTKALLLFIKDMYSNEKKAIKDGIIPQEVATYALHSTGYEELIEKLPLETIAITNGSDINLKRNKEGKIVVIEDNIGSLGGREDIYAMVDVYKNTISNDSVLDPYILQKRNIEEIKSWHNHLPGEYVVFCSDKVRAEETFAPKQKNLDRINIYLANQNDVYINNNKLYYKSASMSNPVEISYLEHNGLDYTMDLNFEPFLNRVLELKDDPKYYEDIPHSMDAVLNNNLILSHAPGSSIADSKIIYPFVEKLIEYYLHEEPILASTKTYALKKDSSPAYPLPSLSLEEAIKRKDELVVKPIRGECGDGVLVGKKTSEKKWKKALRKIYKKSSKDYLLFEFVDILEEDDYLLIHRLFVDAYGDHAATRPGAYLRMKEAQGDGVISTGNPGTVATATLIEGINVDINEP